VCLEAPGSVPGEEHVAGAVGPDRERLVMCSGPELPWPGRHAEGPAVRGLQRDPEPVADTGTENRVEVRPRRGRQRRGEGERCIRTIDRSWNRARALGEQEARRVD